MFQHAGEPLDTSWQLVISKVQHAAGAAAAAAARPADGSGPPEVNECGHKQTAADFYRTAQGD